MGLLYSKYIQLLQSGEQFCSNLTLEDINDIRGARNLFHFVAVIPALLYYSK